MEAPFRFQFLPAPGDLAPYINTLFVFATDLEQLDDILPAYSAQMITFGQGRARMRLHAGELVETNEAFFVSPMQKAEAFSMRGPARACGVSLTALGWAALSRLPVDEHGHRKIDAEQVLGAAGAERLAGIGRGFAAGELDAEAACGGLAELVRTGLKPIRQTHVDFIGDAMAWLSSGFSPDIADLSAKTGLSTRQLQRLCKRFFGKPPARLAKRYRAIRAATLLSQPGLSDEALREVTGAFFDQAHMIKDIRYFTGRTPAKLADLGPSVTTDTLAPEGYGVVDLFGAGS